MEAEIRNHPVNWFVTFTFKPDARQKLFVGDQADWPKIALSELSSFIKRLRAAIDTRGTRLRFAAVTEKHRDGYPHLHVLFHSTEALTYRMIRKGRWPHGYIDARRVDDGAAKYLCKYVAKEATRVRASNRYGSIPPPSAEGSPLVHSESVLPVSEAPLEETKVDPRKKKKLFETAYCMAMDMPVDDAIALTAALAELESYGSVVPKTFTWPEHPDAPPKTPGAEAPRSSASKEAKAASNEAASAAAPSAKTNGARATEAVGATDEPVKAVKARRARRSGSDARIVPTGTKSKKAVGP